MSNIHLQGSPTLFSVINTKSMNGHSIIIHFPLVHNTLLHCYEMGYANWWPLLGLLSWYPFMLSSFLKSWRWRSWGEYSIYEGYYICSTIWTPFSGLWQICIISTPIFEQKWGKCCISTPIFYQNLAKCKALTSFFLPFVAFRVNGQCWAFLSKTQPRNTHTHTHLDLDETYRCFVFKWLAVAWLNNRSPGYWPSRPRSRTKSTKIYSSNLYVRVINPTKNKGDIKSCFEVNAWIKSTAREGDPQFKISSGAASELMLKENICILFQILLKIIPFDQTELSDGPVQTGGTAYVKLYHFDRLYSLFISAKMVPEVIPRNGVRNNCCPVVSSV